MNPFVANANPQFNPPGGAQDPGEHGPYYILDAKDALVTLPIQNVCRDYNYVLAKFQVDELKRFSDAGWLNSFEASAVLADKRIRSRALVVVTDNGWQLGEETKYTWCIRVCLECEIEQANEDGGGSNREDSAYPKQFGNKILWPLPPKLSQKAFDAWKNDQTLMNSTLIKFYSPSPEPFHWTSIPGASPCKSIGKSMVGALHHLKPASSLSLDRIDAPSKSMRKFKIPQVDQPREPLFSSEVVASGLSQRAQRLFSVLRFTAKKEVGWSTLCPDIIQYIFAGLAQECIYTPGGLDSNSFQMWTTLRLICKESKRVVDGMTFKFMHIASELAATSLLPVFQNSNGRVYSIQNAIKLRDYLIPKGLLPSGLYRVLSDEANKNTATTSVFPYIRFRLGISNNKPLPEPVQVPPEQVEMDTDVGGVEDTVQQQRRCSSRLKAKKMKVEETMEEHLFDSISLKMKIETPSKQPKEEEGVDTWVECSGCSEWRLLPPSKSNYDLPTKWFCFMHPFGLYACNTIRQGSRRGTRKTRQRVG